MQLAQCLPPNLPALMTHFFPIFIIVYRWGLECTGRLALNTRLGCLAPDLSEDSEQMDIINAVNRIFLNTTKLDETIHLWKIFPSRDYNEYRDSFNLFKELVLRHIQAALADIKVSE